MIESYLALADQHGLRLLLKEGDALASELVRNTNRLEYPHYLLLWAFLSPESAEAVRRLARRNAKSALTLLELEARQVGVLEPHQPAEAA